MPNFFNRHRVRVVKEEDLKSSAFARVGSNPTDVGFWFLIGTAAVGVWIQACSAHIPSLL
jgi:hypothetical protein